MKGGRWKVKAASKREQRKVYFYYAERERVQAHKVRLKVKAEVKDRGFDKANSSWSRVAQP